MERRNQLAAFAILFALLLVVVLIDKRESTLARYYTEAPAVQSPDVRFVPAELPLFTGAELDYPWRRQVISQRSEAGHAEWQVYLVRGNRGPELLARTERFVDFLHWTPRRTLWASFSSFAPDYRPVSGAFRFDVLDSGFRFRDFMLDGGYVSLHPSPRDSRVAFQLGSIFVSDGERAWKLEGLSGEVRIRAWAPDATALLVTSGESPRQFPSLLHVVPLSGGVTTTLGPSSDQRLLTAWSPTGDRLAYTLNGSLYLFGRSTGANHLVAADLGDLSSPGPLWSQDGKRILVSGRIIDVVTGQVETIPIAHERVLDWVLSPNAAQVAITEESRGSGNPLPCEGFYDRRVYMYDIPSMNLGLLLDCVFVRVRWLSNDHLLLAYPSGPEIPNWRVALLDTQTRALTPLTDGYDAREIPAISPDVGRLLLTGKRLRVYSYAGQLLQEIAAPSGFDIRRASWSTDGTMFAYIVGPEGFKCCL